jgi:hypothetical protein
VDIWFTTRTSLGEQHAREGAPPHGRGAPSSRRYRASAARATT